MSENKLAMAITIETVLSQFAHPGVRADFINKQFGCNIKCDLLPDLDQLRWSLFPRWRGGGLLASASANERAAKSLKLLVEQSDELFVACPSSDVEQLSCRQWYYVLDIIASDKYWMRVPPEARCVHIKGSNDGIPDCDINNVAASMKKCSLKLEQHGSSDNSHSLSDPSQVEETIFTTHGGARKKIITKSEKIRKSKLIKLKPRLSKRSKIEEILILSTDSSSEDDPLSDCSSVETTDSDIIPVPKKINNYQHRVRSNKREVVKPPLFKMDGKLTLRVLFVNV